jgi:hypothetical protein
MGAFSSFLKIIASWSEYFTSKDQIKKRKSKKLEDTIDKNNQAIDQKDTDKVNSALRKHTMSVIAISVFLFSGCLTTTNIEYIPENQKAIPMKHNGIDGWFVPDGVFSIILEKAERYDSLKQEKEK